MREGAQQSPRLSGPVPSERPHRFGGDDRIHANAKLRGARSITPAWHGKEQ
jgi:hypothetical protein